MWLARESQNALSAAVGTEMDRGILMGVVGASAGRARLGHASGIGWGEDRSGLVSAH